VRKRISGVLHLLREECVLPAQVLLSCIYAKVLSLHNGMCDVLAMELDSGYQRKHSLYSSA
jgi:hypothetical protein